MTQWYKVTLPHQWGSHVFYAPLTREETRLFRSKGTVTAMTSYEIEQDKKARAQEAREKLLQEGRR